MTVIISDRIISPPTERTPFRDFTLYCGVFLRTPVVIESLDPDPFYRWLRPMGGMDFVEDFVRPGSEYGVRLDNKPAIFTIVTDRIITENLYRLLGEVRSRM